MNTSSTNVAEIVTFELADGVSPETFLEITKRSGDFSKNSPGFISRNVSRSEDGTWTDLIIWADMDAAKSAQEQFMAQDFAGDLIGAINKDSFSMRHQQILWQQE